ncbi:zinc finger protein 28-like isoform X2 [Wyeomyia smithii]|uniref:zinc finger protein 28-like isoform X2 n=1 Tax=Wyeomyia smithii TaxID=174621 RepID=UPI002467F510|nr:zinc finger protein 28-like isoform X2 [Wyeomyia smithii]
MSMLKRVTKTKNSSKVPEKLNICNTANTDSEVCCILCLRKCNSKQTVSFSSIPSITSQDALQCRLQLQTIFNLSLNLEEFATCRTCWKLVELVLEFQQCCLNAEMWPNSYATGLKHAGYQQESDTWLEDETLEMISRVHLLVQRHNKYILREKLFTESDTSVSVETVKVELCDTDEDVSSKTADAEGRNISQDDVNLELEHETPMTDGPAMDVKACATCNRKFDTIIGFKVHSKRCKGLNQDESNYVDCPICSISFKYHSALKYHMNKHKGIKPYKCRKKCRKSFYNATARRKHELCCDSDVQICPICGDQLKTQFTYANHMNHAHGEARIDCEICQKKFKSKKKLQRHMLVHTNVRNYPCNVCNKAFKSSYAANVHQRIHTQEKPFVCEICAQGFTYKCSLKTHVNREHGLTQP